MDSEELKGLVRDITRHRFEARTIEVKAAADGCPKGLYDTLSSFSNQEDGGTIVFGVDEKSGFGICGVYDPQDLQQRIAERCKDMEPPVRPCLTVCEIDGKTVVAAEIPGVSVSERPVFYRAAGRLTGSYVRIGDADERMTEYEIYSYDAFRKGTRDDMRTVENVMESLWNRDRMDTYLSAVKKGKPNLSRNVPDGDILELTGVTSGGLPTVSGLLVFHDYPQGYFPGFSVTCVSVPGYEIGETGDDGERFLDNQRMSGSIPDMLDGTLNFVERNIRHETIVDDRGHRADKTEYPMTAVREAVLNALVHRDYGVYSENIPVRVEIYRDRIEIKNPGGLYGRTTIDKLGTPVPDTRNPRLCDMLEIMGITEHRYSGIPTIRRECERATLPAPVFSSRHGEFMVTIGKACADSSDIEESVAGFCRTPRSREEIVAFVGKSRNHVMEHIVAPMVRDGRLALTIPEKPGSPRQRYVSAGTPPRR